jgi:hypothetical protein
VASPAGPEAALFLRIEKLRREIDARARASVLWLIAALALAFAGRPITNWATGVRKIAAIARRHGGWVKSPISDLGRRTLAHADARFDLIPGLLIEPNDGRVGLDDLQIDLDAAERRQTPFSF